MTSIRDISQRLIWCIILLSAAQLASGANQKSAPVPSDQDLGFFVGTRAETLGSMKRLGILPPWPPAGYGPREDLKNSLLSLITEYFAKAGIEIVPPDTYVKAYDRLNHDVGGLYDPKTGNAKIEEQRAVYANARREFIETEHLDGYIVTRVLSQRARFRSPYATWDGVRERSTGRTSANGLSELLLTDDTSSGTLPAFSLIVQISNAQHKIVFGRAAGIQLASYYDMQKSKGVNGFLFVPPEQLFQDRVRLERAVRIATLPLILTPEQIAAGSNDPKINATLIDPKDLPPVPAGIERSRKSPLVVPRDRILASVHRIALAPIRVGQFAVDTETQERYLELIRTEAKQLGWEIVTASNARAALTQQLQDTDQLYDPYTGIRDETRISAARKNAFNAVGANPPVDAILWPSFERVVAAHDNGDAEWDGVSQNATTLGPVRRGFLFGSGSPAAGEGSLAAVSLRMQLVDAQDTLLYDGRGGIQLLEQLKGSKSDALAPEELFRDSSRETPAVHAALRDLVLSEDQLDAELNPRKKPKAAN